MAQYAEAHVDEFAFMHVCFLGGGLRFINFSAQGRPKKRTMELVLSGRMMNVYI